MAIEKVWLLHDVRVFKSVYFKHVIGTRMFTVAASYAKYLHPVLCFPYA